MTAPSFSLTANELVRYNRHIIVPDFGLEAQLKLKNAKVLVVGVGGLGNPVAMYLTAAGVGTIGLVDFDTVEVSNLQRQVLFGSSNLAQRKVDVARARLHDINPFVNFEIYPTPITQANALELIAGYDVVADGTDNFGTRYLINDACVLLGKTNVYASVFQFEGQVAVFNHLGTDGVRGPNYRDLFASPPPGHLVPSCAEGGVLGVMPGIVGTMQALEVIKVITGVGQVLSGRLHSFDALRFESRVFEFRADPRNPISGTTPSIHSLMEAGNFCAPPNSGRVVKQITTREFLNLQASRAEYQLIDVREPDEFKDTNIGGELIPLALVLFRAGEISRQKKVIIHCKTGGRSTLAIQRLEDHFGFDNLYNLQGGIVAYASEV